MDGDLPRSPQAKPPGLKIPFMAKVLVVASRAGIGLLLGGYIGLAIGRIIDRSKIFIFILAGMIVGALVVAGFWDRVFSRWYDHPGGR